MNLFPPLRELFSDLKRHFWEKPLNFNEQARWIDFLARTSFGPATIATGLLRTDGWT